MASIQETSDERRRRLCREAQRRYRLRHPDRVKAARDLAKELDPERLRAHSRKYSLKNRGKLAKRSREYKLRNPDKWRDEPGRDRALLNQKAAEYRERRRDLINARARERYAQNPAAHRKYQADFKERHYERLTAERRHKMGIAEATGERKYGPCEICSTPTAALHCDHDHDTGRVRGWLCSRCNRTLGLFGDSAIWFKAAIHYLETK